MDKSATVEGWQLEGAGAEAYEEHLVPKFFGPWARELVNLVAPAAGERVLDVGCGTGVVARTAAEAVGPGGSVTGVDVNEGMLATARARAPQGGASLEWRQEDASALPFSDGAFDVVLSQQALQFVPDPGAVLSEIRRVLRPGGRTGLNVLGSVRLNPAYLALAEVLEQHAGKDAGAMMRSPFPEWSTDELREDLVGAGFREVQVRVDVRAVRFPSAGEFLRQEALSSPLGATIMGMDDAALQEMIRAAEDRLRDRRDDYGLVFPMETRLLTMR